MRNNIKIKFWGTRGSFPMPETKSTFGGNTPCIEVRTPNNELVLLDMGTGLKSFGESFIKEKISTDNINIVLSHFHYDHILGFLMFVPLFIDKYNINIYAPGENKAEVKSKFDSFLSSSYWPVSMEMLSAKLNFFDCKSGSINISKCIALTTSPHGHPGGANSIRLDVNRFSITYITDCEHPNSHIDQNTINIAKHSDVLIHDAQYTPEQMIKHKGWGHSSWEQCVEVAKKSKSKKLVLFHHNPDNGDAALESIERDAKIEFPNTVSAKDEMELLFPNEVAETVI